MFFKRRLSIRIGAQRFTQSYITLRRTHTTYAGSVELIIFRRNASKVKCEYSAIGFFFRTQNQLISGGGDHHKNTVLLLAATNNILLSSINDRNKYVFISTTRLRSPFTIIRTIRVKKKKKLKPWNSVLAPGKRQIRHTAAAAAGSFVMRAVRIEPANLDRTNYNTKQIF